MYIKRKRSILKSTFRAAMAALFFTLVFTGFVLGHTVADTKFGVNAHLANKAVVQHLHDANISWVRMDFRWDLVQPFLIDYLNNQYDWTALDSFIDSVTDATKGKAPEGSIMHIYAVFQAPPWWAVSGRQDSSPPPVVSADADGVAAWRAFIKEAVLKYKGKISHWGIWNEPDNSNCYTGTWSEYLTNILSPGIAGIHDAEQEGTFDVKICGPDIMGDMQFLDNVLNFAGGSIDIVTGNAYGQVSSVMSKIDTYLAHSRGKPFWLTETGYECFDNSATAMRAQALWYDEFLPQIRSRSDVQKVFMYDGYDSARETEGYGIVYRPAIDAALALRPAYHEYRWVAGSDDSQFVDVQYPAVVLPGQTFRVTLTVENTGDMTWKKHFLYKLCFIEKDYIPFITPETNMNIVLGTYEYLANGDRYTFNVDIIAPSQLGPHPIRWQLCQNIEPVDGSDTVKRFGDIEIINFTVSPVLAPPVITVPPASQTIYYGDTAQFSVTATEPDTYQWQKNGVNIYNGGRISGANTAVLTITGAQFSDAANYRCKVTNYLGTTTSPVGVLTVLDPQQPYKGYPFYLPGRIQAEDYDLGGELIAYHDTTPGNICSIPRYRFEDVDVQYTSDSGGGYNVGYIEEGEWLEYTVDVSKSGIHDFNVRVASTSGGAFHIEIDGIDVTGYRSFLGTGGNQTWTTVTVPRVFLSQGPHILRFYAEQSNFNLNWIDVGTSSQAPYTSTPSIPGTLQAEDYDTGGEGIAYHDTTSTNDCYYSAYRYEGVDVENNPISESIINVGYIYNGEWLEYTVDVTQARKYSLNIRAAAPTGGALSIEVDGISLTGTISIPASGLGSQDFATKNVPIVYLPRGKMIIRVKMLGDLFNLDYIEFQ